MNDQEVITAAWDIIRDRKQLQAEGHGHAIQWARNYLHLDEEESYQRTDWTTGHVHGFKKVRGSKWSAMHEVWVCVQDARAIGDRPDTGCGDKWP